MMDHIDIFDFALIDEEMNKIEALDKGIRFNDYNEVKNRAIRSFSSAVKEQIY